MSKNDVTGDSLTSKATTEKYREGWDRIFGDKREQPKTGELIVTGSLLDEIARKQVETDKE
jgi:hypothetical protein